MVGSGKNLINFTPHKKLYVAELIGEFECRLDDKGRLMLPSGLKKQLPQKEKNSFIIKRGIEKHLDLYPLKEWKKETEKLAGLNQFVQKNREFVRKFVNGATEVEMDSNGRLLLPKNLMSSVGIEKDIVLSSAFLNRIEIWSKAEYEKYLKQGDNDFAALAEEVMGKVISSPKNVS